MPKPKAKARDGGADAKPSPASVAQDRRPGANGTAECACHLGAEAKCEYCAALKAVVAAKDAAGLDKMEVKLSSALFRSEVQKIACADCQAEVKQALLRLRCFSNQRIIFTPEKPVDVLADDESNVEIKFKAASFSASQVLPPVIPVTIIPVTVTPEPAESTSEFPLPPPRSNLKDSCKEALLTLKGNWKILLMAHSKLPTALQALAATSLGARTPGTSKREMNAMEVLVLDQMRNDVLSVSSLKIKEAEDVLCESIAQVAAAAQKDMIALLLYDEKKKEISSALFRRIDELGRRMVNFTNIIREIHETSEFVQSLKDAWDAAVKAAEMARTMPPPPPLDAPVSDEAKATAPSTAKPKPGKPAAHAVAPDVGRPCPVSSIVANAVRASILLDLSFEMIVLAEEIKGLASEGTSSKPIKGSEHWLFKERREPILLDELISLALSMLPVFTPVANPNPLKRELTVNLRDRLSKAIPHSKDKDKERRAVLVDAAKKADQLLIAAAKGFYDECVWAKHQVPQLDAADSAPDKKRKAEDKACNCCKIESGLAWAYRENKWAQQMKGKIVMVDQYAQANAATIGEIGKLLRLSAPQAEFRPGMRPPSQYLAEVVNVVNNAWLLWQFTLREKIDFLVDFRSKHMCHLPNPALARAELAAFVVLSSELERVRSIMQLKDFEAVEDKDRERKRKQAEEKEKQKRALQLKKEDEERERKRKNDEEEEAERERKRAEEDERERRVKDESDRRLALEETMRQKEEEIKRQRKQEALLVYKRRKEAEEKKAEEERKALEEAKKAQMWTCELCTLQNHGDQTKCSACSTDRAASLAVAPRLSNPIGENNCFLNVVTQSLWHVRAFAKGLTSKPDGMLEHCHTLSPTTCLTCSLQTTLRGMATGGLTSSTELRAALSACFANRFALGEQEDASEAFESILTQLHAQRALEQAPEDMCDCVSHQSFGMSFIEGVNCRSCLAKSTSGLDKSLQLIPAGARHFSTFIRYVPALFLGGLDINSFPHMNMRINTCLEVEPLSCPICDEKGMEVSRVLYRIPLVYTVGVSWMSGVDDPSLIKSVLSAVAPWIDVVKVEGRVQRGETGEPIKKLNAKLIGMMCFYGKHYAAFFKDPKRDLWLMFDDAQVREVGATWIEAARMCLTCKFQPVAIFYEVMPDAEVVPADYAVNPL